MRSFAIASVFGVLSATCTPSATLSWKAAVENAARTSPQARILVLDLATGRVLASHRLGDAARTLAEPGSTLKPLILYELLAEGLWNPNRRVACNRALVVAGRRLACAHPPGAPFNAREALAWSCNSYFAEVARLIAPGELGRLLRPTGLLAVTGMAGKDAPAEAAAEFREPTSAVAAQLTLLGVEGIRITPLELAAAYRWLALQLASHPHSQAAEEVSAGIKDSASFGMARPAGLGGVAVMGKTGTARSAISSQSHGWFAGITTAETPQVVIVVYEPAGRGVDAAAVAADVLAHTVQVHR